MGASGGTGCPNNEFSVDNISVRPNDIVNIFILQLKVIECLFVNWRSNIYARERQRRRRRRASYRKETYG